MFIHRRKYDALTKALAQHEVTLQELKNDLDNKAILVSIEPQDRFTLFTFVRNGKIYQIKAMSLWGDDRAQWEKDLLG